MNTPAIAKEDVLLNVAAADWQAAVRTVGALMHKRRLVEPRYIDAMVEVVKNLGPYIVLAPGIAFPHARPEDGALATGICLVTLKQPVAFGSQANDPVKVVIGLASTDSSSHIGLLSQLCAFLEKDANVSFIKAAADEAAVASLINKYGRGD